jgi:ABC-type uncharacterized transport system auxiliary subunit
MNRAPRSIVLSLFVLTLSGCLSSKPIRYYTIQSHTAPALSTGTPAASLLVAGISGPEILRRSPIAYRVGANEIGTYPYNYWEEPPVEMIQNSLMRLLISTGNYQSVVSRSDNSSGQFVIRGRLNDFEEVDGASITGLVSMQFDLFDKKSGKVVWSHSYSQYEPVQGKEISSIVTALDVNLDRGLREVAAGLNQYFSTNPAGKP